MPVTQYQSPNPELQQIMKTIRKTDSGKDEDENPVVFFRGEHLAVRNAEGSFYLCQSLQNIHKTSKKIRIQWLSLSDQTKGLYAPEYYDRTGGDGGLELVPPQSVAVGSHDAL